MKPFPFPDSEVQEVTDMIHVLSVENMRASDAKTISDGIPGRELMLRAAERVMESVEWKPPIGIVCGSGNNAGDGYALAILLKIAGFSCAVILLSDRFSADGRYYYERCLEQGVPVLSWQNGVDLAGYGTVVDCIWGTGFRGIPHEPREHRRGGMGARRKARRLQSDVRREESHGRFLF